MGVPGARAPHFLDSERGRAFRALRHRPFRLLFFAFLINQTGFWISHISIQGLMVELTGNNPSWLGWLFFTMFLPAFVLAPVAGVAADRFDRKHIVLSAYAAVAGITATLSVLSAVDAVAPRGLLAIGFALGTCFAFSGPASMAIAANSVPEADLASAVSLQATLNNLTRVAGPALAAPLVASKHFEVSFAAFTVAASVAAILTGMMHVAPYEVLGDEGGILARMHGGLRHARERRPALPALLTVAALSLFGVSHTAVLPVFAERALGDTSWFAWMVAATGLGAALGALLTGYRKRAPSLRDAAIRTALYGVLLASFAELRSPLPALGVQLLIGYFYFSVMTGLQTLVQQIVAEHQRGRVMSLFQVCWAGLIPFGGLGMGTSAAAFGVTATLSGGALVCILFGTAMAALAPRLTPRFD